MRKFIFPILKLQLITILFNLLILAIYLPLYMYFGESGIGWIAFYVVQFVVFVLSFRAIGKFLFKSYDHKTANKIFFINLLVSIIFSEIMVALIVYNSAGWIPMSISNSFFTSTDWPIFAMFSATEKIVFFRISLCYILEDVIRYLCLRAGKRSTNNIKL